MLKTPLCSVSVLAKVFQLSERRVQQLANEGIIPRAHERQYPLLAAMQGYIVHLKQQAKRNTSKESAALQRERLRLLKAQADHVEHENYALSGQWLNASEVKQAFEEVGAVFVACVDALPGRLAAELTGMDDPALVKAKLFEACRHLRHSTGEHLHALGLRMRERDRVGQGSESIATQDTGSVGGQSSLLTARQ